MSDDLHLYHKEAPETEEDWQRLHRAVHRADQGWPIMRPAVAFTSNYKAWLFALAMLLFFQRSEISAAIDLLIRGK